MSASRGPAIAALLVAVSLQLPACSRSPTTEADRATFRYQRIDAWGPKEPWGKSLGDLNGDGRIDLIVGGRAGGGLVWYENPSWTKHVVSPEGPFSTDHEVVDIDGDGKNDIVSLLIRGLVWFKKPAWEMAWIDRERLHDIEIADLNADGRPDIVARRQSAFGTGGDKVFLYLQKQDQQWTRRVLDVPAGEGLALADVDDDGHIDVVINGLWLRNPGRADTAWTAYRYTSSWTWPHTAIVLRDINRDGRIDIVLAPAELAGTRYRIAWFDAPVERRSDWREHVIDADVETVHHFVAVADVDLDGQPDVLSAAMHQGQPPHEVKVYMNLSGDRWNKHLIATTGSHNMRVADIDGDGDTDALATRWTEDKPDAGFVFAENAGSDKFRVHPHAAAGAGDFLQGVAAARFRPTGRVQIALSWHAAGKGIQLLNVPDRPSDSNWSIATISALSQDEALTAGDIDRDGRIDLLLGTAWLSNEGDGSWRLFQIDPARSNPDRNRLADINRDGRLDAVVGFEAISKPGDVVWYEQGPDATIAWQRHLIGNVTGPMSVDVADIDRDGDPDVIVGEHNLKDPGWPVCCYSRTLTAGAALGGSTSCIVATSITMAHCSLIWTATATSTSFPSVGGTARWCGMKTLTERGKGQHRFVQKRARFDETTWIRTGPTRGFTAVRRRPV